MPEIICLSSFADICTLVACFAGREKRDGKNASRLTPTGKY